MTSVRTIILILLITLTLAGASVAAEWSDDVQVSSDTDILNVELEYDPNTGNLFAVICWAGDGCTSYFSDDVGESWTGTFSEGPGATVNDISCLYHKDYFYVVLATPLVLVLYRFDPATGAPVAFGSDTFIIISYSVFEEVDLSTPHSGSDLLCFVGHDNGGRILANSWDLTGGTSAATTSDVGADRGLDAASHLSSDGENYTWMSIISYEGFVNVYRFRWSDANLYLAFSMNLTSSAPDRTAIAIDGIPGLLETVYCAFEYSVNPTNIALNWSPGWAPYYAVQADSNVFCPELHVRQGEDLALVYTHAAGLGPHAPTYGRFVLHPLDEDPGSIIFTPRENPATNYTSTWITPDLEYLSGVDMYGLLYASRISPNHAYFTKRTPGCCGEYTGGITGNANCSGDGKLTLSDISRMIDKVYISKAQLCCHANGNTNASVDCKITLSDITALIDAVYISKTPPAACMSACEQ
jgi:hypothetical protein